MKPNTTKKIRLFCSAVSSLFAMVLATACTVAPWSHVPTGVALVPKQSPSEPASPPAPVVQTSMPTWLAVTSTPAPYEVASPPASTVPGPAPTKLTPTKAATSAPLPPIGCLDPVPLTPGVSLKEDVIAAWGNPADKHDGYWHYDVRGTVAGVDIDLVDDRVSRIWLSVSKCSLGEVVAALGPPEAVEIITPSGNNEPPVYAHKNLHYASRGMAFEVPCVPYMAETCAESHVSDPIDAELLYPPSTVSELVSQSYGTFLPWDGLVP